MILTQLNNFQNCNFMFLLFGHIFKLRRSTLIKCNYVWRYISTISSSCQIFLCNNFRNMAAFPRRSRLKWPTLIFAKWSDFLPNYFVCQFCKRWYVYKTCLIMGSPYSNNQNSSIMLMVYTAVIFLLYHGRSDSGGVITMV